MGNHDEIKNITNKLTVLYVEDDILIRKRTTKLLESVFNKIIVASNGQEGITKYKEYYEKNITFVDIVISDITMPILDGLELSKQILDINPNQKIIITSANGDRDSLIEFINLGVKKFLSKPFDTSDFFETLYEISLTINKDSNDSLIYIDNNYIWNKKEKTMIYNDETIKLSKNEKIVLDLLITNYSKVYSNYDLLDAISFDTEYNVSIDSIKSIIKRLRKKIPQEFIINIYGEGYQINKDLISNKV